MSRIVIVFSKTETGKRIQEVLMRYGFEDTAVCSTGAKALQEVHGSGAGLVICGFRLTDMHFTELKRYLPPYTELLLVASGQAIESVPTGTMAVETPVRASQLVSTIRMMEAGKHRSRKKEKSAPRERSPRDLKIIEDAKHLLMERNHLSEDEAHRYLQKQSMDTGRTFVETAEMIQMLLADE